MLYAKLQTQQQQQVGLLKLQQMDPVRYSMQPFGQYNFLCYRAPNAHNYNIVVPDTVLPYLVAWYHQVSIHIGETNLLQTIGTIFHNVHLNR